MRIALCNEVIAGKSLAEQCAFAAALGYDGLELAPFTLSEQPHLLGTAERTRIRSTIEGHGLSVVGLHWLLVAPKGLSITTPDKNVRASTVDVMHRLIDLCAALGGTVIVHGSPAQRGIAAGEALQTARARAIESWAAIASTAEQAGIAYCIEPLSQDQTPLVNTLAEAAEIVAQIGSPAVRTMLDTSSAGLSESQSLAELVDRWLPSGLLAHIQVNDRNRRGPGQGSDKFAPLFAALKRHRYAGAVSVEPFDYIPDGPAAAARAIGYIRGIIEAQA
ncbi:MAG: sugar phosphate isomerase/epimerase [Alphaproteobacteria bacterium]|nr:sugar phosphate isomerase/epimerase [Alphaproteobacteria bacterium]